MQRATKKSIIRRLQDVTRIRASGRSTFQILSMTVILTQIPTTKVDERLENDAELMK